jgi:hypothetical protein
MEKSLSTSNCGLTVRPFENILESMLIPMNLRFQTRKLPNSIHFRKVKLISRMTMPLQLDLAQIHRCVDLMGSSDLYMTNNFILRYLNPLRKSEEVLSFDAWIAKEVHICHHGKELGACHGRPALLADVGVVNAKFRC